MMFEDSEEQWLTPEIRQRRKLAEAEAKMLRDYDRVQKQSLLSTVMDSRAVRYPVLPQEEPTQRNYSVSPYPAAQTIVPVSPSSPDGSEAAQNYWPKWKMFMPHPYPYLAMGAGMAKQLLPGANGENDPGGAATFGAYLPKLVPLGDQAVATAGAMPVGAIIGNWNFPSIMDAISGERMGFKDRYFRNLEGLENIRQRGWENDHKLAAASGALTGLAGALYLTRGKGLQSLAPKLVGHSGLKAVAGRTGLNGIEGVGLMYIDALFRGKSHAEATKAAAWGFGGSIFGGLGSEGLAKIPALAATTRIQFSPANLEKIKKLISYPVFTSVIPNLSVFGSTKIGEWFTEDKQ